MKRHHSDSSLDTNSSSSSKRHCSMQHYTTVFWSCKGGSGKTNHCLNAAIDKAVYNENVEVLLIDLDPQCNMSMMMLGEHVFELTNESVKTSLTQGPTVFQWLYSKCNTSNKSTFSDVLNYLNDLTGKANVSTPMSKLPKNIKLLPSHMFLTEAEKEFQVASLANYYIEKQEQVWVRMISALAESIQLHALATYIHSGRQLFVYIDCGCNTSPALGLAMTAADKWVLPVGENNNPRIVIRDSLRCVFKNKYTLPISFAFQAFQKKTPLPQTLHILLSPDSFTHEKELSILKPSTAASAAVANHDDHENDEEDDVASLLNKLVFDECSVDRKACAVSFSHRFSQSFYKTLLYQQLMAATIE